jgi:beta-glucosidase
MTEQALRRQAVKKEEAPGYKNPDLPVDHRVADLLSRMTLQEKVAQMMCVWGQKKTMLSDDTGNLDLGRIRTHLKDGIGQMGRLSDTGGGKNAPEMAALANRLQKFFVEETRLGIPVVFHEECLHGLAGPDATSYPQPIGLASTFNPELIEQIYTAIAEETRSRGAHQALTPVVDVARDPRWGRVEETFGEDPYLVSRMGIAAVRGFQGDGTFTDKKRVLATLKHFAAHGQPESGSNCGPGNFSERVLRDTFLFPFKEVLEKANPASVMASYNEIDGVPSHANAWLLRNILRKEWGFKGFVVSDYYAITELKGKDDSVSHAVAKDKTEAALRAAQAGVNIELPDPDCYPLLPSLVERGVIPESLIDELIAPMLEYKFRLGLFEDPYVSADAGAHEQRMQSERALALRAAQETIVLLKNNGGVLPLRSEKYPTIAVIGPNADRRLLGGYSGKPRYYTTVLQGIQERVGDDATVLYSEGCKITVGGAWDEDVVTLPDPEEDRQSIARAVSIARQSDVVVLVLGDNEQTSREAWSYRHLGDRTSLDLFGAQNALVQAVAATGKPMVLVLFNGRPNSLNVAHGHVAAILECWYLGQETGHAVADVLFGDFNPAGKLPISIPRSVGHLPCYYNHKPSARRGYLFDDITPLYPFGFGMSYTTFAVSNPRLESSSIHAGGTTRLLVDVKNTGPRIGQEVVQMYIRDLVSSVTRPVKELKGFAKISLTPGESRTVALPIGPEHLSFTNIDKQYGVEPGDFEIMVGTSSRDEDLSKVILHITQR